MQTEDAGARTAHGGLFYLASLAPTLELDLGDHGAGGFVGVGLVLGAGSWSHSASAVQADGSVLESETATGLLNFIPGLEARAGWRFGDAPHHLTVGLDVKALATLTSTNVGPVAAAAASSTHTDGIGWAVVSIEHPRPGRTHRPDTAARAATVRAARALFMKHGIERVSARCTTCFRERGAGAGGGRATLD